MSAPRPCASPSRTTRALLGLCAGGLMLLAGCLGSDKPAVVASVAVEPVKTAAQQYAALQQSAKGIAVGPAQSDYTVYVLFDPQCLHCARLWEEAWPLRDTVRFVWVPVAFFDARSTAQSAVLLASSNPLEDLAAHEASVLARGGGIAVPDKVPGYTEAVAQANTALINRFHVMAVPYVVARDQTTSEYVTHVGGMSREVLKRFLGIASR